ncbi:hypothetical protein CHUAL_009790 [Chamberlinius hualienensis]
MNGYEQPFLKRFKVCLKFAWLLPAFYVLHYILTWVDILLRVKFQESDNEEVRRWPFTVFFSYVVGLTFGYLWIGSVQVFTISQFTTLYKIFDLLSNTNQQNSTMPSIKQVKHFIYFHRKACRLVILSNEVFTKLSTMSTLVHISLVLFHASQLFMIKTKSSILFMAMITVSMCAEIIGAGLVNRIVKKSLERCYQIVHQYLPAFKESKISIKLELYSTYVKVRNPYLTYEGIVKIRNSCITVVINFIITYVVFLYKRSAIKQQI